MNKTIFLLILFLLATGVLLIIGNGVLNDSGKTAPIRVDTPLGNPPPTPETAAPKLPENPSNTPKILQVLGARFYLQPTPENMPNLRLFQTKDRKQVLKINFTTGNKQAFLDKLEDQFFTTEHKVTYCPNQNVVFEAKGEVYQVFVLSAQTIVVLMKPTGYPAEFSFFKALCEFNPATLW